MAKFSLKEYEIITGLIKDELKNYQHGEDDLRKVALEEALTAVETIGNY